MIEWLTNASTYSAKPSGSSSGGAMSNLFGGGKTNNRPTPVAEWDGTACRDCFSVLNVTQFYSADQVFNVTTFSSLYTWVYELYFNRIPRKTPTDESDDDKGPSFPLTIDARFKDAVVRYCGRLLEQSKLVAPNTESRLRRLPDLALYEALRLVDAMSFLDPELVKKQFTAIKKLYSLSRPSLNKRSNAYIFLEILEYFLHHGEVVLHDPDPLLRQYFDGFLSENFMDPIIALETLWFCLRLKAPLVQHTNVLTLYFHSLLKAAAWHPVETIFEFNELIPTFASPTTYLELFHALLDLPLLTATLEKLELERDTRTMPQGGSSSMSSNSVREMMSDKYGVLFHLLLRKESGVVINFWDSSQTLSLVKDFCRDVEVTPRIRALADTVPQFLETFFKVVIEYADENMLLNLLPVVFERVDQLFPFKDFETRVRTVLVRNVLAIFQKFPHFIVHLKTLILEVIRDSHTTAREELVLSLCWAAGEYSSLNLTPQCTIQTLYDYDEALELFAFERMVIEGGDSSSQVYNTRVMLVVISSLTKLASRWQPLASRVVLCLAKLLRHKSGLHPSVVERTFHCLALLKFPSIAASILDSPLPNEIPRHHIDANSSLPFLLRPVSAIGDGKIAKIHPFM
jgi:AP-5 complex subunit zeta-1